MLVSAINMTVILSNIKNSSLSTNLLGVYIDSGWIFIFDT